MTKRRKVYEKARNIVRNNLEKRSNMVPNFGAKTAHYVIKAYHIYQKQCLVAREKRMRAIAEFNMKLKEEEALKEALI